MMKLTFHAKFFDFEKWGNPRVWGGVRVTWKSKLWEMVQKATRSVLSKTPKTPCCWFRAHISRIIVILSCPHVSSSHCTHHVIHWPRSLSDCQLWCAVEVVVSFRYPSLFLVSHLNIFSSLRSFPCMSQR